MIIILSHIIAFLTNPKKLAQFEVE